MTSMSGKFLHPQNLPGFHGAAGLIPNQSISNSLRQKCQWTLYKSRSSQWISLFV